MTVPNLKDFKNKCICVFGLRGSGKTYMVQHMLETEKKHIIYDTNDEYPDKLRKYVPSQREEVRARIELDDFIAKYIIKTDPALGKIKVFAVDEANRYAPGHNKPLMDNLGYLTDMQRHMKLTTIYIARRPTQINTDIIELSDYIFIFNLAGKNDMNYLNDLSDGLGVAVQKLKEYQFVFCNQKRDYEICQPV